MIASSSYTHTILKEAWSFMPCVYALTDTFTTPLHLQADLVPEYQDLFQKAAAIQEEASQYPHSPSLTLPNRIAALRDKAMNYLYIRHPRCGLEISKKIAYIRSEDRISDEFAKTVIKSVARVCQVVARTLQNHHFFTNQQNFPERLKNFHLTRYGQEFLRQCYTRNMVQLAPDIAHCVKQYILKSPNGPPEENFRYALKSVPYDPKIANTYNEAFFTTLCEHPYIVPISHVERFDRVETSFGLAHFPMSSMRDHRFCSEPAIAAVLLTVLIGLSHMHEAGVMHNDLKKDNILVKECPTSPATLIGVIADLGLASFIGLKNSAGTISFLPPETLFNWDTPIQAHPSKDIWSIGILLLELLTLKQELDHSETKEEDNKKYFDLTYQFIKKRNFYATFSEQSLAHHIHAFLARYKRKELDPDLFLETTVKSCLALDPRKRPTAKELAQAFKQRIDDIVLPKNLEKAAL